MSSSVIIAGKGLGLGTKMIIDAALGRFDLLLTKQRTKDQEEEEKDRAARGELCDASGWLRWREHSRLEHCGQGTLLLLGDNSVQPAEIIGHFGLIINLHWY